MSDQRDAAGAGGAQEPQFVLQMGGKIYVTQSVRAHDPNRPGLSQQEQQMIEDLQEMLRSGPRVEATVVGGATASFSTEGFQQAEVSNQQTDDPQ